MNEKCDFVQALKQCTNNHLPNIILYDAHGTNPLIDMAFCVINFDLNICKNAWNLNFCRYFTNFNEILKLNFTPQQFFNYDSTRNKSYSEKYERMILLKQNLKSTISNNNKKLIREKKYMDRLTHANSLSVHSRNVLSLQHLAWNKMLINANPTTVYCLCNHGPKYVVCADCAKHLFLITPPRIVIAINYAVNINANHANKT